MDPEFRDNRRRQRAIIAVGVILALVAGGAAFYLVNQAQQQAADAGTQKAAVVVAIRAIPARQAIVAEDVTIREVPLDETNAAGVATDVEAGHRPYPGRDDPPGPTRHDEHARVVRRRRPVLHPGPRRIGRPGLRSLACRVPITVSDDLAVGGLLEAGETVDVFVTAIVTIPTDLADSGKYMTDRSTKITYQNVLILAREGAFYIIRAIAARGRGDLAPAGRRVGDVQHGPPARYGPPASRCHDIGRDHQPDHREVWAAHPGDLSDRHRPVRDAGPDRRRPLPVAIRLAVDLPSP